MEQWRPYCRKALYYETDQMQIIHHSNYIRWFEEARVDVMDQMGFSYGKMEEMGLMLPVLNVSCKYRKPVRFGDEIAISVRLTKFSGVKLSFEYEIKNLTTGEVCTTGTSEHGIVDSNFRPFRMNKEMPDMYRRFQEYVQE